MVLSFAVYKYNMTWELKSLCETCLNGTIWFYYSNIKNTKATKPNIYGICFKVCAKPKLKVGLLKKTKNILLNPKFFIGSHWVQFIKVLWLGSVVKICGAFQTKKQPKREEKKMPKSV